MNKLPLARTANLVVQKVDREFLIYDLTTNKAFCLNETIAVVYQACDGVTSFDRLKAKTKFTDDLILFSLDELRNRNLVEEQSECVSHFAGMSRRETIKKVGMASMIALPLITSLVAPTAANAVSGCAALGASCTTGAGAPNTRGTCCDVSARCLGATCVSCFSTGLTIFALGGNAICEADFNASEAKRLCCNGGQIVSVYNPAADSTDCNCP